MRSLLACVLCLTAACDQLFNIDHVNPPSDGHTDQSDVRADGSQVCLGTGALEVCVKQPLDALVSLSGNINTSTDTRCRLVPQSGGLELCVIAAQTIRTSGITDVTGSRPLVLAAIDTVQIEQLLDVSSRSNLNPKVGPGSGVACLATSGADGTTGAGGGAGGSLGFKGGDGSDGEDGASRGGAAALAFQPVTLQGGCAGTNGGIVPAADHALGGVGGGGVWLIAGNSIAVRSTGSINASGAGGRGGAIQCGGGGGGAGGVIALDAPIIEIAGDVFARGGGGGGGGGTTQASGNGGDAINASDQVRSGTVSTGGSGGGDGCGTDAGGIAAPAAVAGGGGGGGGCGIIHLFTSTLVVTASVVPAAS